MTSLQLRNIPGDFLECNMVFLQLRFTEGTKVCVDHIGVGTGSDRVQEFPIQRGNCLLFIAEIVSAANVDAHKIRLVRARLRQRGLRIGKVHIFTDLVHAHILIEYITVQQRFAQVIKVEIAACTLHGVFALAVATNDTLDPLGGDAVGVVHHFDEDELAVSAIGFVHVENGMSGGAGTGEGVEDDRIRICCDL